MKKQTKNIPQLRFPEFKGEWTKISLRDKACKIGSGITPKGGSRVYQDTGIIFIRSQNVNQNMLILDNATYISEELHTSMKGSAVAPNDILLNITGASIGRSCVVPTDIKVANVNQHVCIIRLEETQIAHFYQLLLSSFKGQKLVFQAQAGGGREGLNFQNISSFKIFIPTFPEQQKIASFLSVVDKKIQQLTRKRELLEKYKKGVMQKIFSQEIRFKDENGKDYPDWEEKKLGDLGKIITGKTPNTTDLGLWGGKVQFVTPSDIKKEGKYQDLTERYVIKNSKIKILPIGSILYTCIASIGKMSISVKPCITNQQINAIVSNGDVLNEYIFYALLSVTSRILATRATTTLPIINKTEFSKIMIVVPYSKKEQQKIASFLSGIDDKKEQIQFQITQTQSFKKALLQRMFA